MRLASWRTNLLIGTTNIELQLRVFATLKPQCSLAGTVWSPSILETLEDNTNRTPSLGKQKITDQIAQLKYKDPNSPRLVVLEQELVRAEAESLVAEAQLSNITREKVKAAFAYQFDSLREHCEKLAIIAGYGKHLLELIDDTPVTPGETRPPYDGYEASKAIIQDCEESLTNWVASNAAVSSKLSTRSRTLSQRRRNNIGKTREGVDLAGQDRPMRSDRDSWVPAQEHSGYTHSHGEEEEEEFDADEGIQNGVEDREEERIVA